MRSIKHLSPRYVAARVKYGMYTKLNPDKPWITPMATNCMGNLLCKSDVLVEFGSGRSTAWLAKHVEQVVSVEHNPEWYARVQQLLDSGGIQNVDYRLCTTENDNGAPATNEKYLSYFDEIDNESIDVVFVDGMFRNYCALHSVSKVKSGGLIVIDNCNWFLPSVSRAPNSRSINEGPLDEVWNQFSEVTREWRTIWTTCGVSDTVIYFKP